MARMKLSTFLTSTLIFIILLADVSANATNDSDVEQNDTLCGAPENRQIGTFTAYDYSIVLGMLIISLGIGVFYGFYDKKSSNSSADFLHGTEMSLITVSLSLTTSFITAIELLGNPSEMFFNGTQYSLIG